MKITLETEHGKFSAEVAGKGASIHAMLGGGVSGACTHGGGLYWGYVRKYIRYGHVDGCISRPPR